MSIISRLGVVLGLDSGEFNAGLGKAEGSLNKFAGVAKGVGVAAIAAIGYELINTTKQAIDFADSINDIAKANEISVGKVLEFSQALSVSGGKAEDAAKIFANFTNKIDDAAKGSQETRDKFAKLGITLDDLRDLDQQQLFIKTLDALGKMPDQISRNALAMDMFGKSMKGVDVKGTAEDFKKLNGTMEGSTEQFTKIGDAVDRFDRLSMRIKTDIADNIGGPLNTVSILAEKLYDALEIGGDKFIKSLEKQKQQLLMLLDPFKVFANLVDSVKGKLMPQVAATTPPKVQEPWVAGIVQGTAQPPKRVIEETKEEENARKKIAQQIENQTNALNQQVRTLKLQTAELGNQKSEYQKVLLEFEKGGKYYEIRNSSDKQELLDAAQALDAKKHRMAVEKVINDYAKERERLAFEELKVNQQMAAQELIRKQQHDDALRFAVDDIDRASERLDLERSMAGFSDTQVQKALALFDLQSKLLQMKRQDGLLTEKQINDYAEAENRRIKSDEANTRAQNTFQAGWNKAYNNFMEKAKDSAAIGSQAFGSMTANMNSAIDNFVRNGKLSFSSLTQSIIADLIAIQMKAQVMSIFGSSGIGGMFSGLFGGSGTLSGASIGLSSATGVFKGFASGGDPAVGVPSLVGENGPEIFIPRTNGTIIPNMQMSQALGGGQAQTVYNGTVIQNMNAIDTQSGVQFLIKNKDTIWAANMSANRSIPMSRG